jgi:hypothetical protein
MCTSFYTSSTTAFVLSESDVWHDPLWTTDSSDSSLFSTKVLETVGPGEAFVYGVQVAWRPEDLSLFPESARPQFNSAHPNGMPPAITLAGKITIGVGAGVVCLALAAFLMFFLRKRRR